MAAEDVERTALLPQAPEYKDQKKLSELLATAICGNDVTGSILYAAGVVSVLGGRWAPVCFLLVAIVLYGFRDIYAEAGSALPMNGGSYTLLLNVASKRVAAAAASLTLLSYVATAVVTSVTAINYLHETFPWLDVFWGSFTVLLAFTLLALWGIKESALSAFVIFAIHVVTLIIFVVATCTHLFRGSWEVLHANLATTPPLGDAGAIYFGFSAALLGVTGFETSANYIEEQAPGVYPKTLRNVWLLVFFFNPLISFISLALVPAAMDVASESHYVSQAATAANIGQWLPYLVRIPPPAP